MSKTERETIYILDHANKLADRDRENPNRRKRRLVQIWDKLSGETTAVEIPDWRESESKDL